MSNFCWLFNMATWSFVKMVAMEIFSAASLLMMWQRVVEKKNGWRPVWKFEKVGQVVFCLMQCLNSLSIWGLWFRVMVGTTMYTGDVWSSLDLLSSEIQNFLVTMSLPRYTTELTHWMLKKDAMSANLKKKNLYSKIGLIH